ncbi:MAG: S8 family serine peptidase [Planctomycetes bacterium]|nr:S8 family serine peptidase [Planctomycetota bacterium]
MVIGLAANLVKGQQIIERPFADQIAQQKNWLIRADKTDHGAVELQKIVNGIPLYYETSNLNAAISVSTNKVWSGGVAGLALDGTGVTLGIWDGSSVRRTHQDLNGRVTLGDAQSAFIDHSTHVACTMIGTGLSPAGSFPAGQSKGMSFRGRLTSFDFNNDESEMRAAAAAGLLASNHSYGLITGWSFGNYGPGGNGWYWFGDSTISQTEDYFFGFYSFQSQAWDKVAFDHPNYLIVAAAGNDRNEGPSPGATHFVFVNGSWVSSNTARSRDGNSGYDCMSHGSISKNVLSVGAVNDVIGGYSGPGSVSMSSFSSWGPADDSRIKPDIVGNGVDLFSCFSGSNTAYGDLSGTSMATPNVSGSLGLLIQHYRATHGGDDMRAATLKGLVIHTADECGSTTGPDYVYGWGLLNTATAAGVITQDSTEPGTIQELAEGQGVTLLQDWTYTGSGPIKATISWTDPAGTPPNPAVDPPTKMLVNDLDLRLIGPGSVEYQPWRLSATTPTAAATGGDNDADNVEVVSIASPPAGQYTVKITHKGTLTNGYQRFSLILTGLTAGPVVTGACCTGISCIGTMTEADCSTAGGTWYGGLDCSTFTCPPLGACCIGCPPSSTCNDMNEADCLQLEGHWTSVQTCASVTCGVVGDTCATDIVPITDGVRAFDNICATTDGPTPVNCEDGSQPFQADIWFAYTATCTGNMTASLCSGTGFDTMLAIYANSGSPTVCPCPTDASLQFGACGDDTCGVGGGPSELVRTVTQGNCYTIRVGGWSGTLGSGQLTMTCVSTAPNPVQTEPSPVDKNRFISFVPQNGGSNTAIRVKFLSLQHPDPPNLGQYPPPDFSAFENQVRWVASPGYSCESGGSPPCVVPGDGNFVAATLQCNPYYADWPTLTGGGVLHVTGAEIVPSSAYNVEVLPSGCQGNEGSCSAVSTPLILHTARWGDVATPYQTPAPSPLSQPDIADVAAVVDKFKTTATALSAPRVRLQPSAIDLGVPLSIGDIAANVDAFKNMAYPYAGPSTCP